MNKKQTMESIDKKLGVLSEEELKLIKSESRKCLAKRLVALAVVQTAIVIGLKIAIKKMV